jgi:organic hydroperoxide reductase OsmC/OhrA
MSEHHAGLIWRRGGADFTYDSYSRAHDLVFKNGALIVPGSSAVAFRGDAARINPEEALVSALSSCHMLTFLAICARKRLVVDAYEDDAVGTLEKGANGKLWVSRVILRPKVEFAPGSDVDAIKRAEIHHIAHVECFIANSVKTEIAIEPR